MRLTSILGPDGPYAALVTDLGRVPLPAIARRTGTRWPRTVEALVRERRVDELQRWAAGASDLLAELAATPGGVAPAGAAAAPLLSRPPKILGVGLNYAEHAGDLGETRPDEPATFMKPATTIIAAGQTIQIPRQSQRTTGEAELGLIVGTPCKDVAEQDALSVLAGVTTIIDMTAEDILQRNPRFLTRAKSFDGFLVLGPDLVTMDEIEDLGALEVATLHDAQPVRRNVVANMLHSPRKLVAFFSAIMPLEPGDVISTGTPGAVVLSDGDTVGCAIPGVGEIACPVRDLKAPA